MKKIISVILSIVMVLSLIPFYAVPATAEGAGQSTPAFSISVSGNTFIITRSDTSAAQTVRYRTVSGHAISGVHFTAARGTLSFTAGQSSKTVTVTEASVSDVPVYDRYQVLSNSRNYFLEVYDDYGQVLARGERVIDGYNANFSNSGRISNGSFPSNYAVLANCYSPDTEGPRAFDSDYNGELNNISIRNYLKDITVRSATTTVTDAGYAQAVYTVTTQPFFDFVGAAQEYLASVGAKLYLKTFLHLHEIEDGYQYIQILVDNPNGCDTGAGSGNPGNISASAYMCGFEHGDGYVGSAWSWQAFPYRESDAGKYEKAPSYAFITQKINSAYSIDGATAALVIPASAQQLSFRLNASGSGGDDWEFENLTVRGLVVDKSAPVIKNIIVNSGDYRIGQYLDIAIEFNEIIDSAPSRIVTNFGTLSNCGNIRTNVVTYRGQVSGTVGSNLTITGFESGSFADMFGNSTLPSINHTVTGVRLIDNITPPLVNGEYRITDFSELYKFIEMANSNPSINGILMNDINVNPMGTVDYVLPKLGDSSNGYLGTFDGNGHAISGLLSDGGIVAKLGATGIIKDLTVSVIRAYLNGSTAGIFCTDNSGTIERTCVNSEYIADTNVRNSYSYIGLLAGTNNGTVSDCLVSGVFGFDKGNSTGAMPSIGGIAGVNNGTVESSCFAGTISVNTGYNGHNATVCVKNNSTGVIDNCYGVYTGSADYEVNYSNSGSITDTVKVTEAQLSSGEVAYNLNRGVTDGTQVWYQNIDNALTPDAYPKFTGGTVYKRGNHYTNNNTLYDINSDGVEDVNDIGFIISASAGNVEMTSAQAAKSDLNGDTVVDAFDAAWLDRLFYV